jgi:2-C-methyl-D-erythritol 4-phosphate cytidylyltransferase/2-C-methyl-D-erythritol 2,4-cyclodiphosphate synthase
MRDLAVVLVAAGQGTRLGLNIPKAFVPLHGVTLVEHGIRNLLPTDGLRQIVLVAPQSHLAQARAIVVPLLFDGIIIDVVAGGETRQGSISAGLKPLLDGINTVLVHDAARCLTPFSVFNRVAAAVRESLAVGDPVGVIPVLPVVDTIKRADGVTVVDTVDRNQLRIAQTPQGFPRQNLVEAYSAATTEHTDDAALFQDAGGRVITVIGDSAALKITTTSDLAAAERLLALDQRTGIGTDVHRFAADGRKPLVLAGIEWPEETALEGHSDGDAVAHAVVDALLSAAGLGDIGGNFGVDRPEYAGASGEVFIKATLELLAQNGWRVVNVGVQVIGNRPKLSPHRQLAEERMTWLVGAPVTIGATTTDGLGFLGNSEGVAAVATALIVGTPKVG